jgi:DNA-binding response OmpR family regulator
VQSALDGESGLQSALDADVDLVVLDMMLPRLSGATILSELVEQRPGLPVIVVTARGELEDRVEGLHAGAVDYVVKPFALAELQARIQAQLRAARQLPATTLRHAGVELDMLTRRASYRGHSVNLSATEFNLLAYFLHHPDIVLSRERILRSVWGYQHDPGTNIVDVYVGYLRRKLGSVGAPAPIHTLRSLGYKLLESR